MGKFVAKSVLRTTQIQNFAGPSRERIAQSRLNMNGRKKIAIFLIDFWNKLRYNI